MVRRKRRREVGRFSMPGVEMSLRGSEESWKKLSVSVAILAVIAVTLIHYQDPQLYVYTMEIPSPEFVRDSPTYIQNIGNGYWHLVAARVLFLVDRIRCFWSQNNAC